jgi:hypothetical protein
LKSSDQICYNSCSTSKSVITTLKCVKKCHCHQISDSTLKKSLCHPLNCSSLDAVTKAIETIGLATTNVVNVFHYISRFITDQFGPNITNTFQTFQVDGIVSGSAITPTIIFAPLEVNPTSLIHQFVNIRCRPENFDALSLLNDPEVIKNARKSLLTAMNRGNWVLVHYSKQSRAAAGMLVDVFKQMSATSVNTNFRLMIVASSLQYIAPSMIGQSKRIQNLIVPEFTDDGFSAARETPDADKWVIPGNVSVSTFLQIVQQLALCPTTDILGMHPGVGGRYVIGICHDG